KETKINGKPYYVVDSDVNAASANYSRVVSYVATNEFLPAKSETYDKDGKLLKVIEFSNYKQVGKGKWRAGKIMIRNVQNNRATEIALANIKIDQNLKPSGFTPKALRDD